MNKDPRLPLDRASETLDRRHLPHLDGLRACLAMYVVIHHVRLTIWPTEHVDGALLYQLGMGSLTRGRMAVDWFIVLSGFCLMLPTLTRNYQLNGGTLSFYRKRARRILPTYWVAVLLSALLCLTILSKKTGTHWDVSLPVTWQSLASALLLTNDIFDSARINHALWSIAVEWRIYFVFPLILFLWRKCGGFRTTLLVVGITTAIALGLAHLSANLLFLQITLSFLGLFAMGAYAAHLSFGSHSYLNDPRLKRWLSLIGIASGVLALASIAHLLPKHFSRDPVIDLFVGLSAAACMASWAMPSPSRARAVLSWWPLPAIGEFAFSLYLIHAPLIQICWQLAVRPAHLTGFPAFLLLLIVSVPVSIAGAFLFFLAFERPFLSSRQRQAVAAELPILQSVRAEPIEDLVVA